MIDTQGDTQILETPELNYRDLRSKDTIIEELTSHIGICDQWYRNFEDMRCKLKNERLLVTDLAENECLMQPVQIIGLLSHASLEKVENALPLDDIFICSILCRCDQGNQILSDQNKRFYMKTWNEPRALNAKMFIASILPINFKVPNATFQGYNKNLLCIFFNLQPPNNILQKLNAPFSNDIVSKMQIFEYLRTHKNWEVTVFNDPVLFWLTTDRTQIVCSVNQEPIHVVVLNEPDLVLLQNCQNSKIISNTPYKINSQWQPFQEVAIGIFVASRKLSICNQIKNNCAIKVSNETKYKLKEFSKDIGSSVIACSLLYLLRYHLEYES